MKTIIPAAISTILSGLLPLGAFEVHEWGTFTTVAGSDGILLTGLQREEEHLPPYVHHHPGFRPAPRTSKQMPVPARNVRVKMETPVIYFHSDRAINARVTVGFEGGSISQWYPQRSGGEQFQLDPAFALVRADESHLDFARLYRGSIEWQVEVLGPAESRRTPLFHPSDLLQWTHARVPEANSVRTANGETEGFLFYRGLGSFEPGLRTRIDAGETLRLENRTGAAIPYLLVYEMLPDGNTRWLEIDGLGDQQSLSIPEEALDPRPRSGDQPPIALLLDGAVPTLPFDRPLFDTLLAGLAARGLQHGEAEAMVKTWWNSYFGKPGLRVFWVLPGERTDAILPLSVDPRPDRTVRVLVGRSEVIRPRQEREWLQLAGSDDASDQRRWNQLRQQDRFGLAYGERIDALLQQASTR